MQEKLVSLDFFLSTHPWPIFQPLNFSFSTLQNPSLTSSDTQEAVAPQSHPELINLDFSFTAPSPSNQQSFSRPSVHASLPPLDFSFLTQVLSPQSSTGLSLENINNETISCSHIFNNFVT